MEEGIKNRAILILSIFSIILLIGNISSCSNASRQKTARDKEMSTRLDLEEKMSKFNQQQADLEEKLKVQEKTLAEEKVTSEVTKKALVQEQLANQNLKEELQKVTKLKEALEEDLKEALVNSKTAKQKK